MGRGRGGEKEEEYLKKGRRRRRRVSFVQTIYMGYNRMVVISVTLLKRYICNPYLDESEGIDCRVR